MMTVKLKKEIYSYKNLQTAIDDYDGYALIKMNENDSYWELLFSNCKYDEERTGKEFENYLIGMENK